MSSLGSNKFWGQKKFTVNVECSLIVFSIISFFSNPSALTMIVISVFIFIFSTFLQILAINFSLFSLYEKIINAAIFSGHNLFSKKKFLSFKIFSSVKSKLRVSFLFSQVKYLIK